MTRTDWNYSGDIDLKCGGMYFRVPDGGDLESVEAVEVTDLSGAVGGPDNVWMIEWGDIYMPREKWQSALDTCGYVHVMGLDRTDLIADGSGDYLPVTGDGLCLLVDAFRGYSGIEDPMREVIQIGRATPFDPDPVAGFEPERTLHGNRNLRRYVEKCFID